MTGTKLPQDTKKTSLALALVSGISAFAVLAGPAEQTAGDVTRARGLTISHVPQEVAPAILPLRNASTMAV